MGSPKKGAAKEAKPATPEEPTAATPEQEKPAEPEKPKVTILSRKTIALPTKLSDPEKIERGTALARVLEEIKTEEAEQEATKREMKSTLAALEAERDRLSNVVARGEERRSVEVEERADHEQDVYTRVRLDSGEVLERRPLHDDERQVPLPLADGGK